VRTSNRAPIKLPSFVCSSFGPHKSFSRPFHTPFHFQEPFYLVLITRPSRQVYDALNRLSTLGRVEQRKFSAVSTIAAVVIFIVNKLVVYCRDPRMNRSASSVWDNNQLDLLCRYLQPDLYKNLATVKFGNPDNDKCNAFRNVGLSSILYAAKIRKQIQRFF